MTQALLISIKPEHVANILTGKKVFEFRKKLPSPMVSHLVIYATAPYKKVVAVAEVEGSISGSRSHVWRLSRYGSGISKKYFEQYFPAHNVANAFIIGSVFPLVEPITLTEVSPELTPPQSYNFLSDGNFDRIRARLSTVPSKPRDCFFLGGIHGVGKSTLCETLFTPLGYYCCTASSLIKNEGGIVKADKRVMSLDINQQKLIHAFKSIRTSHARLLLDGHLTLITGGNKVSPIPVEFFRHIGPTKLILLTGKPSEIARRQAVRGGKKWQTAFIRDFQETEIRHAHIVAEALGIPLIEVDCDSSPVKIATLL